MNEQAYDEPRPVRVIVPDWVGYEEIRASWAEWSAFAADQSRKGIGSRSSSAMPWQSSARFQPTPSTVARTFAYSPSGTCGAASRMFSKAALAVASAIRTRSRAGSSSSLMQSLQRRFRRGRERT